MTEKNQITIKTAFENPLKVYAEYAYDIKDCLKSFGFRFNPASKCWRKFCANAEEAKILTEKLNAKFSEEIKKSGYEVPESKYKWGFPASATGKCYNCDSWCYGDCMV